MKLFKIPADILKQQGQACVKITSQIKFMKDTVE